MTRRAVRPSLLDGTAPEWIEKGLCTRSQNPDLWFPGPGAAGVAAKLICQVCPVISQCRLYGLDEKWGIWGGVNATERKDQGWGRGRPGIDYAIAECDK